MKKIAVRIVALDMLFLLLLMLSGALIGVLSDIAYFVAYLVPIAVFFFTSRTQPRIEFKLRIKYDDAVLLLPVIAPTILITVGISALCTYVLSLAGAGGAEALKGTLFELLILHALIPAALEEVLFRYFPLTLLSPYSKKSAIVISAILFAVSHCNLAQIPYALAAGIIFAASDIACGSILPSLILHFINNFVSVLWLWDKSASAFRTPFLITVAVMALISIAFVVIFRTRYAKKASFLLDKDDKIAVIGEAWVFVAVCAALAVSALF